MKRKNKICHAELVSASYKTKKALKSFQCGRITKRNAFTLAEVLITLMIIGVVAALTIPSVISNYQQQEFKTGLKKAVSVLNEAIQVNIAQEGETPYDNNDLFSYLQRHMGILKSFQYSTCYNLNGELVKDAKSSCPSGQEGGRSSLASINNKAFYTTDGMRFEFVSLDGDSGKNPNIKLHETNINPYVRHIYGLYPWGYGYGTEKHSYAACGSYGLAVNKNNTINPPCVVMVDVNGDKKPNPPIPFIEGNQNFEYSYPMPGDKKLTDIFNILITDEKAIPYGVVAQRAMYSK